MRGYVLCKLNTMPTGYTAGILDGTIKDFPQFAKLCMRAFGATIMMRDEPLDKPWEPRAPSDYHLKAIEKANAELDKIKASSDEYILAIVRADLLKRKEYHEKAIVQCQENHKRLDDILIKAEAFSPPTPEHEGIKEFMVKQLKETIAFDAKDDFHVESLEKINAKLRSLNARTERAELISKANKDLSYHTLEYEKELKRCEESNTWVEQMVSAVDA